MLYCFKDYVLLHNKNRTPKNDPKEHRMSAA